MKRIAICFLFLVLACAACDQPTDPVTENCVTLRGERITLRSNGTYEADFASGRQEGTYAPWNDLVSFKPKVGFMWAVEPRQLIEC